MKLTHIGSSGRLEFNDLGKVVKAVAPQERNVALNPGQSIYITDGQDVMYSAQAGDAKKFAAAGLLAVNDIVTGLANAATFVIDHGYGFIPSVTIARDNAGVWEDVTFVATNLVTVKTNVAMTQTIVTNVSGGALTLNIRVS